MKASLRRVRIFVKWIKIARGKLIWKIKLV